MRFTRLRHVIKSRSVASLEPDWRMHTRRTLCGRVIGVTLPKPAGAGEGEAIS